MKDKLFDKALNWVTSKGFKDIKANTEAYESPLAFSKSSEGDQVIPDITGRMHGSKSYVEIVTKEKDVQLLVTRWKLFGTVALRKGGKLYLITGKGYKTFADNIVKNYNLQNVQVVNV